MPGNASQSANEMRRTQSSGTLRKSGEATMALTASGSPSATQQGFSQTAPPAVPKHLSVHALTKQRKLASSTGNLHGYMAEDYHQINWPLPKMFGHEKYGYSLIDITDPRYLKECAAMSKKLIRLSYDQQLVDHEWRKTYKALLDAEDKKATLWRTSGCAFDRQIYPFGGPPREGLNPKFTADTEAKLQKKVSNAHKYLQELQEQKDLFEREIQEVYARCDAIKAALKKERDLEDLRVHMEGRTKGQIADDSDFWRRKFNIHREKKAQTATGNSFKLLAN